jgi:hypothetical protein
MNQDKIEHIIAQRNRFLEEKQKRRERAQERIAKLAAKEEAARAKSAAKT